MSAKYETKSSTALWRLDLLEAKFLKHSPRYNTTRKLLAAKRNHKVLKKLPDEANAQQEIDALKKKVFHNKFHGAYKKLRKEVAAKIKADKNQKDDKQAVKLTEEITERLVVSKLIKTLQNCILTAKELKQNPPAYFPDQIREIVLDKANPKHPAKFFIDHCQNDKELNSYVSSLWNTKGAKKALSEIEWSFKIVRGNLTKKEKDDRRMAQGKAVKTEDAKEDDSDDIDSESDDVSDDASDEETDGDSDEGNESDVKEHGSEEAFDKFAVYDTLVAASDEEDEKPDLDPNTNYNEVTDEEASSDEQVDDDDSFFEESSEEESTEKKYKLPQLATGYYSGGSDDEDSFQADDDAVVKQATTLRKNRRGQRARQKIWEKKYGKSAKHKEKERTELDSERKRRQAEYEERERKRQMKAELAPTGSNVAPLGVRGAGSEPVPEPKVYEEHPSWVAKKLAEEKLKNTKFTGKKIVFD